MQPAGQPLSDHVRARLLALGIPAAKHLPEGLTRLVPSEFNIDAAGLDAEDVAKVLVYLVEKKIISVDEIAGMTTVKKVHPGWHFCQFYRDYDQLLDLVTPYIAEGLRNGEACFWVMPKAVTNKAACEALARHVEDRLVASVAEHRLVLGVHRIERGAVLLCPGAELARHRGVRLRRLFRRADHGDRLGMQERVEIDRAQAERASRNVEIRDIELLAGHAGLRAGDDREV